VALRALNEVLAAEGVDRATLATPAGREAVGEAGLPVD